ncbi:MAG: hypothetical protein MJZ68_07385 [archaeon]|nr:hypothetical protein [archaeon]
MTNRFAIPVVILLIGCMFITPISDADSGEGDLLLDNGNGSTSWYVTVAGDTVYETVRKTLEASGHTVFGDV